MKLSSLCQVGSETIHQLPLVGFKTSVTTVFRLNLKHPPTAVGGITAFFTHPYREVVPTCLLPAWIEDRKR